MPSRIAQPVLYPDSRPWVRWWWFSGEVREEDVRAQLDWVERNGFGGVEVEWVYPLPDSRAGAMWLSAEWGPAGGVGEGVCQWPVKSQGPKRRMSNVKWQMANVKLTEKKRTTRDG